MCQLIQGVLGETKKSNLKLTARGHENRGFTKKEKSFPTTIFQGRTVKLSRSYNFHCGGCAEVLEKNGSYVGDPLKVAEIYNPYIRGFG